MTFRRRHRDGRCPRTRVAHVLVLRVGDSRISIGGRRVFEVLGVAGIAIAVVAYLPQVVHMAKEHCSAGVSSRAWLMWLISSLLIGTLAIHREDAVFILLQISNMS